VRLSLVEMNGGHGLWLDFTSEQEEEIMEGLHVSSAKLPNTGKIKSIHRISLHNHRELDVPALG